jgi:hypothetical protein
MKWREFIMLLGGAATWRLAARPPTRMNRVGRERALRNASVAW